MGHSSDQFDTLAYPRRFKLILCQSHSSLTVTTAAPRQRAQTGGSQTQRRICHRKFLQFSKKIKKSAFAHQEQSPEWDGSRRIADRS